MRAPRPVPGPGDRPQHPMAASIVLVTGIVLLIVALSVAGTIR